MRRKILLATIGSLGDLHPCIAIALALRRRGHQAIVASTPAYRARVESVGLEFRPIRPDWQPDDEHLIAQCEDLKSGPEVLFRKLVLPHLEDTYTDLLQAASSVDLMIAGELVFAAPLAAEKLGLRWASAILSPASFFSAHDPSLLVNAPGLFHLRGAGWRVNKAALRMGVELTRHWWEPVRRLRRQEGLSVECEPLMRDKFSPDLVLALFSPEFASPQPDWPANTVQTGFVFFDGPSLDDEARERLNAFLACGEAPLLFTLGSTAVSNPGNFFTASKLAAERLSKRAILLGKQAEDRVVEDPDLLCLPYAPYRELFPSASVIVHQGGSGTTGHAMLAGKPMLVVPYGWDQPDNGERVKRLGSALSISRLRYSVNTAVEAIRLLLENPASSAKASAVGVRVAKEDGLRRACEAIEGI